MSDETSGANGPARLRAADLAELVRAIYAGHYRAEPGRSLMTAALESIAAASE